MSRELSKKQVELLRGLDKMPNNPCATCYMGISCCGCREVMVFEKFCQQYKDADLIEEMNVILDYKKKKKEKERVEESFTQVNRRLIDTIDYNYITIIFDEFSVG